MKITNITRNAVLADKALVADSLLLRIKGLLGKKELKSGEALVIKPCNSIHTMFMQFNIDVLFVSKDNRVVKVISSLRPFRLTRTYFSAHLTIELPSGIIESSNTCTGDIVKFD